MQPIAYLYKLIRYILNRHSLQLNKSFMCQRFRMVFSLLAMFPIAYLTSHFLEDYTFSDYPKSFQN